jgi:hypothetical protein
MSITIDGIALPNTLVFVDEFTRSVAQLHKKTSLTGKLIAQHSTLISGLPITLKGGPNHAWVQRPLLLQLRASADAGEEITLHFHGTDYTVIWDHERGALEVEQLRPHGTIKDSIKYRSLILRFVEV